VKENLDIWECDWCYKKISIFETILVIGSDEDDSERICRKCAIDYGFSTSEIEKGRVYLIPKERP
jgi:hypothetical protein